jgi:hypothetical protein
LRWNWGSTKVSNFLKSLSDLAMINQKQTGGQTIIKLLKYNEYNDSWAEGKPSGKPPANQPSENRSPANQGQTRGKPPANQIKEREERKENNNPLTPLKGGKTSFDFSFVKDEFSETFQTWLSYKKEKKQAYKSQKSIQACYSHLVNLARGDAETARIIVEQSMANNWAGIFELKNKKNITEIIDKNGNRITITKQNSGTVGGNYPGNRTHPFRTDAEKRRNERQMLAQMAETVLRQSETKDG